MFAHIIITLKSFKNFLAFFVNILMGNRGEGVGGGVGGGVGVEWGW